MKDRVKVVQLCAIDETMDKLLKSLNMALIKSGYEVIAVSSKGELQGKLSDMGLKVRNVNIDRNINPMSNIKSIVEMYKLFKEERPQIVHVHTPVAAVLGRIAAKLAKVPIIVYTAHGFYFHENMSKVKYMLFLFIEKVMARLCTDYIFTQSNEDLETAIINTFKKESRMIAIGNGVDVRNRFNPINIQLDSINTIVNKLNINEDDFIVTFIGRLVKEKGILDLLKSYQYIEGKVKFIIVGDVFQGDRDRDTYMELKRYESNENIKFVGKICNVEDVLSMTDVFCLPSYREGMPRSIIEAMAMECAVVATNIRGSREEVVDGDTGFLVEVNDSKSIAEKIDILIKDKELLSKMKYKARERALNLYDEDIVVKKQLDVMEKLLEEEGII